MNITSVPDSSNGILTVADVSLLSLGGSCDSVALWRPPGAYFRTHFLSHPHVSFLRDIRS